MSSRRTERLVNLVICLLSTRQYLTANRIRQAVPGYAAADGTVKADEAFKRMFERDKAELRELGIPLETGRNSVFDSEDGYRIARRDYELPDIELEPDEAAAVGLAARLWQTAGLADASRAALLKLRAAGIEVDETATVGIEPRVNANEPAFGPCLDAVRSRQAIRFRYRGAMRETEEDREVEPWGVVSWHGRWYLVAHDRVREALRCFRLSRITGAVTAIGRPGEVTVPEGVDLVSAVASSHPLERRHSARIAVRKEAAAGLRRSFPVVDTAGDRDVLEVAYNDPERLAERIAGYGTAVFVLDPPDVRDAVIRRLRVQAYSASERAETVP
ncbi:MAG TPA: WYL domain-containing protein [Mycobacteriales bacterium]|nr:WYL domain-containing protein [Mycobacteriales bacterium]